MCDSETTSRERTEELQVLQSAIESTMGPDLTDDMRIYAYLQMCIAYYGGPVSAIETKDNVVFHMMRFLKGQCLAPLLEKAAELFLKYSDVAR